MIPLVTADEMRAAERRFAERGGDLGRLMELAGTAVAERVTPGRGVLILAGPGNNGGDALVCARQLRDGGNRAVVVPYKREVDEGLAVLAGSDDKSLIQEIRAELGQCDAVVDGLLGTGPRRAIEGILAEILDTVNRAPVAQRIAIDIPTGIDADTGQVDGPAFRATLTVTLGMAKRGLWSFPGAEYAGRVEIVDLGLSEFVGEVTTFVTTEDDVASMLPTRSPDSNKGKNGRVLVVAGSRDFSGAPALVASAAYRAGAGLVEMAVASRVQDVVAGAILEPIFAHLENSIDHLTEDEVPLISAQVEKAKAFVVGPGLGSHSSTVNFVRQFLQRQADSTIPGVLDADGLNAIAAWESWWDHVPRELVLTPHPGEMARLMDTDVPKIQRNRFEAARSMSLKWGVVVVLKGAHTIVADPSGTTAVNTTGGPNLATAGTGDVLSGTIGGLLAQGMSPREAAIAGVWIHGAAGDSVRDSLGDAGTIASDLTPYIPVERLRITQRH
jgi:NAD(P)H-hydrate epimerase